MFIFYVYIYGKYFILFVFIINLFIDSNCKQENILEIFRDVY